MPRNAVIVVAAFVVVAGLVSFRALTLPGPSPAALSDQSSPCGQVGFPAEDLGIRRARELTFCLLNEQRGRRGVQSLRYDARLELASQRHSDDMVRRDYFEHDTPEGVEPHSRMLAAGYPADNAFTGENIAWGEAAESSPVEIMDSWMHSRSHREALLNPSYTEVGVGVAVAEGSATYTTDFGGPPIR